MNRVAKDRRRRVILPLILVALDALVLAAWMRVLAATMSPAIRPPGALVLVGLACLAVGVLTLAAARRPEAAPVAAVAGALVSCLALARLLLYPGVPLLGAAWLRRLAHELAAGVGSVTSVNVIVAAGAFVWWRAAAYATVPSPPRRVRGVVSRALFGLAGAAVAASVTGPVELAPYVMGSTALALAALAASRVDESYAVSGSGGMGPAWGLIAPAGIAVVMLFGTLLSLGLSLHLASALSDALRPLPEVLGRAIIFVLALVADLVARIIVPLIELFSKGLAERANELGREIQPIFEGRPGAATDIPHWIVDAVRIGTLVLTGLAVAWWLARAVRRYTIADEDSTVAGRTLELSGSAILADIADWVAGLRNAVGAARQRWFAGPPGVRRLYRSFLREMSSRGHDRPGYATPLEFAPGAAARVPAVGADVADLTAAYTAARYGDVRLAPEALERLKEAEARIRATE